MKEYCSSNLLQIKNLLEQLESDHYNFPSEVSDGATIGQHVRHILEFYICLLNGVHDERVNYDKRERNLKIQTDPQFAAEIIDEICSRLSQILPNQKITVISNHSTEEDTSIHLDSSLYRELAYNLEHCIHHQALIKIILKELQLDHLVDSDFGVAPATVRYQS